MEFRTLINDPLTSRTLKLLENKKRQNANKHKGFVRINLLLLRPVPRDSVNVQELHRTSLNSPVSTLGHSIHDHS